MVPLFAEIAILDEVLETLISSFEVGPNHKVEVVTVKLSMLLALASAGRSSVLTARYLRYMSVKDNSIAFELAQLTESGRKGQSPIKQNLRVILCCVFSQPLPVISNALACRLQ